MTQITPPPLGLILPGQSCVRRRTGEGGLAERERELNNSVSCLCKVKREVSIHRSFKVGVLTGLGSWYLRYIMWWISWWLLYTHLVLDSLCHNMEEMITMLDIFYCPWIRNSFCNCFFYIYLKARGIMVYRISEGYQLILKLIVVDLIMFL